MIEGDDFLRRPRRRGKEDSVARQIRVRKFVGESGSLRKLGSRARRTRANGNLCDTRDRRGAVPPPYFFAASSQVPRLRVLLQPMRGRFTRAIKT